MGRARHEFSGFCARCNARGLSERRHRGADGLLYAGDNLLLTRVCVWSRIHAHATAKRAWSPWLVPCCTQEYRGKPDHFHLVLKGDSGYECTEALIGETIYVDVQCRDSLGLPATVTSEVQVHLKVIGSSEFRGRQEIVVDLGTRTLRTEDLAQETWWTSFPVFFLPKDQPSADHPMNYVLHIDDAGLLRTAKKLQGQSRPWTFQEEKKVARVMPEGREMPEIDAAEVHRFHEDSQVRTRPELSDRIERGGEAEIWNLRQGDVARELLPEWWHKMAEEADMTDRQIRTSRVREFLKDVCIWKRVSEKCGGRVAELRGWYLVLPPDGSMEQPVAGFQLKGAHQTFEGPVRFRGHNATRESAS